MDRTAASNAIAPVVGSTASWVVAASSATSARGGREGARRWTDVLARATRALQAAVASLPSQALAAAHA